MARRLEAKEGIISIHNSTASRRAADTERRIRRAQKKEERASMMIADSESPAHEQLSPVSFKIGSNGRLIFEE